MAKSKSVEVRINYPYPDIMVIERYYEIEDGFDANRPVEKLPKGVKKGWVAQFTVRDKFKANNGHIFVAREVYAKKASRFPEPVKTKGKCKRHFRKVTD